MEHIDLNLLREDFERFSHLHSWYKHLPLEGTTFYVFLHNINPQQPKEQNMNHWIFISDSENNKSKFESDNIYRVNFGPFLRGNENRGKNCEPHYHGLSIIKNRNKNFNTWIEKNYPEIKDMNENLIEAYIFESEYKKYKNSILDAMNAKITNNELKNTANILKIANADLNLIDSILISHKIAELNDIFDSYDEYFEKKDYNICEKLKDQCYELWENKYRAIYRNEHSKIYFPLYKDDYENKDCSGWDLYINEKIKNTKFNFMNELNAFKKYMTKIKIKIIILSDYIERYTDYHNEYSIDEIISIRKKYMYMYELNENEYKDYLYNLAVEKHNNNIYDDTL